MWTYSHDPASSTRDAVRFLVGDTDQTKAKLQDEEIEYLLTKFPNVYFAAAEAADSISATFAQAVNKQVGALSISFGARATAYRDLALRLRQRATRHTTLTPFQGGQRRSGKQIDQADADLVQPYFSVDMDNIPSSSHAPNNSTNVGNS